MREFKILDIEEKRLIKEIQSEIKKLDKTGLEFILDVLQKINLAKEVKANGE